MLKLWRKLMRRRTHVMPVTPNDPNTKWAVITFDNAFDSFLYDLRSAGLGVAWFNLKWIVRHT